MCRRHINMTIIQKYIDISSGWEVLRRVFLKVLFIFYKDMWRIPVGGRFLFKYRNSDTVCNWTANMFKHSMEWIPYYQFITHHHFQHGQWNYQSRTLTPHSHPPHEQWCIGYQPATLVGQDHRITPIPTLLFSIPAHNHRVLAFAE